MDLGIVRVKRYTSIQDVGKAIHPDYVEGQLHGGCVQGIGWALSEEYIYNKMVIWIILDFWIIECLYAQIYQC